MKHNKKPNFVITVKKYYEIYNITLPSLGVTYLSLDWGSCYSWVDFKHQVSYGKLQKKCLPDRIPYLPTQISREGQRSHGKIVSPYYYSSSSSLSPNIYFLHQTSKDSLRILQIFNTHFVWTIWWAQGKVLGWCLFHVVISVAQTFKPFIKLSITGHISNTPSYHCVLQSYMRCDKIYSEGLYKKNYYSKRHIAITPPQNTPPRFEHTYPIVIATFRSSPGSPLSWVSLFALSWQPQCPESIWNVYFSWSFYLWGRARGHTVPDLVNEVDKDTVIQWRSLIIISDNVITRLLLSKSVVPKHSI